MATNTFIVSDETINCYGCIVLTAGINTARFERNPVMYYMHDRDKGVIGRWENIRKDGTKLLADAVFDDGTELGAKVRHQVETGFLRTASVGLENIKYEEINGVKTIVECDLYEISIVDVPANENAVKLYAKGRKPVTLLSQLTTPKESKSNDAQTLRVRLIDVLGLGETATDNEIVAAVKELLKEPSNAEKEVDEAVNNGLISDNDRKSFTAMAKANIKAFRAYCAGRREAQKSEIETLLKRNSNKVIPQEQAAFRRVGERMGVDVLRGILEAMHGPAKLSEVLRLPDDKSQWGLDEYRKYAPEDLRDNPSLYKRLVAEAAGHGASVKDLAYYRKYDPEYLATHPDFYRQLIENEQKRK